MEWLRQKRISWLETTLAALKGAVRRGGASTGRPAHLDTGIEGEDAAFFYLRRKGYMVVARRWSTSSQRGDLDLIAWQGPMLCFIEVKTRTAHDMAPAEATVDWHKRTVLRKLARRYVRQLPMKTSPPVRFDILSVYLVPGKEKEFVHFEAAFGWSEQSRWDGWDDWA
jgi:putative endonuclease